MARQVLLDASALLTLAYQEPGAEQVADRMPGGRMSVVNWSEALARWLDDAGDGAGLAAVLGTADVRLEPVRPADAWKAAELFARFPRSGLSLADRICLATASRLGAEALTADRRWAEIHHGVDVIVIR